jgi:hypothetical protein
VTLSTVMAGRTWTSMLPSTSFITATEKGATPVQKKALRFLKSCPVALNYRIFTCYAFPIAAIPMRRLHLRWPSARFLSKQTEKWLF